MKKYKKGHRITSIAEFEEYVEQGQKLFILGFTSEGVTRHIGFIQSLQYRFLKVVVIQGGCGMWVAERIENEQRD